MPPPVPHHPPSHVPPSAYAAIVYLGTPPRAYHLLVDTGSTTMYVNCAFCGADCGANHVSPPYDPRASATAKPVACAAPRCRDFTPLTCKDSVCAFSLYYAEGSTSAGESSVGCVCGTGG